MKELAEAVQEILSKRFELLSWCCGNFCSKVGECEEQPSNVTDWEPRYCKSIIKAAFGESITFDVPFPNS